MPPIGGCAQRKLFSLEVNDDGGAVVDLKCNYFLVRQLDDFDAFVTDHGLDLQKVKLLTAIIWLNMAPLHDYDLGRFLFYFGKVNLCLELNTAEELRKRHEMQMGARV